MQPPARCSKHRCVYIDQCVYVWYLVCFSWLFIAALWSHAGKWLTSLFSCRPKWCVLFLSLSQVVSWVRCGAWLYWFLIIAFFLTLPTLYPHYRPTKWMWTVKIVPTCAQHINVIWETPIECARNHTAGRHRSDMFYTAAFRSCAVENTLVHTMCTRSARI